MAKTFRCRLVTPEAKVLDEPATAAVVPAWDGQFGVLPDHAPIVAQLGIGELRIDFPDSGQARGGSRSFVVDDGFVQMAGNELMILARRAIPAESLSESDAQAELAQAQSRRTDGLSVAEMDRIAKDRQLAAAKLQAAKNVRGRGGI